MELLPSEERRRFDLEPSTLQVIAALDLLGSCEFVNCPQVFSKKATIHEVTRTEHETHYTEIDFEAKAGPHYFFGKIPVTTMRKPHPSGPPEGEVAQQRIAPPKLTGCFPKLTIFAT